MADSRLRTRAWHGDEPLTLDLPEHWDVEVWWPRTPQPVTDDAIVQALERPVGQQPIRELARDKRRPLIIVDDLTRPTPAGRVLPFVLRQLADAGIPSDEVRIVIGTGTHQPPPADALAKKLGPLAAASCRVLVHDHTREVVKLGRTSFGTPVLANREVMASDLVIGVGGVYPQHSTGFGGGSKLALSVLGKRSIIGLHYGHPSGGGSYDVRNDFRRDLDEIARMIGLGTSISLHVNADRDVVRVVSGDHQRYYEEAVAFAVRAYLAPPPGDADVVISNAYPIDVSLTFMHSKGIIPLLHARPGASRVIVSACTEGVGHHGLFPFVNGPRFQRQRHVLRILRTTPAAVPAKAARLVSRRLPLAPVLARQGRSPSHGGAGGAAANGQLNPIWLYAVGRAPGSLPGQVPGMTALYDWNDVLDRIQQEQPGKHRLDVAVYPCAPLQVLDLPGGPAAPGRE
jgi:nickel-dependent lactate racemase